MKLLENWEQAFSDLPEGISKAEMEAERRDIVSISASGGEICKTGASSVTTIYARVSGDISGTACTQDIGGDLKDLLNNARENGMYTGKKAIPMQEPSQMFQGNAVSGSSVSVDEMREKALQLEKALVSADESICGASAEVRLERNACHLVSADGADIESDNYALTVGISVQGEQDGFGCGAEFEYCAGSMDEISPEKAAQEAVERLRVQRQPESFVPGKYRVLLEQPAVWNLMLTAWLAFSGPHCQAGTSCLKGKMGQKIGASYLNISDYPSYKGCGYRSAFDFEGTSCQPISLMRNGKMTGMLHNLQSAEHFGVPSNGRAGRAPSLTSGIPNAYTVTPRICLIEPGVHSKAELIQQLGDGLRITDSYDPFHCLDIASGHFSIPCRGIVYQNGKPVRNVSSIAIHGTLEDLFQAVEAVGNDLLISPFIMTHAYCVGAPSLLIKELTVSGK